MSKFKYTESEQQFNTVLNYHAQQLESLVPPNMESSKKIIKESEELLKSLGYNLNDLPKVPLVEIKKQIEVPTWEEMCVEAESNIGSNATLETLFTNEELQMNHLAIKQLNEEFNALHRLDKYDITISATAGLLGGAIDILLVGIPQKTPDGLQAGALSDYIRQWFENKYPKDEMEKLANSKVSKVPYDAQDNRNTEIYVEGLSSYYHRLLTLGHDPLLGFLFGVFDILTGRMTTIDKAGRFVSQVMPNYADRKESDVFAAIAKQIIHLKTDVNTSMGLPVPFMSFFNLLQFGSVGEAEQSIAQIVQGMYYEGYDFIHFCSMSIPVMIIEVIVRIGYAFKRLNEGFSIKESIPFSLNREKKPKLSTMLFIGHSASTSINAGKIYFTKNPMSINYPQWIAFAKYSYKQLKWCLLEKPVLQDAYVRGVIIDELNFIYEDIDRNFENISDKFIVIMN